MRIYVKNLDGETVCEMDLEPTDKVQMIKEYIEEKKKIPVGWQRILWPGKILGSLFNLEDDKTLKDYNVQEHSTLLFMRRLGGRPCTTCIVNMAHHFAKDLAEIDEKDFKISQIKCMADRALDLAKDLESLYKAEEIEEKIRLYK